MSREILFRGKCNITNEWVFGLYGMTLTKRHYIDSIFKNMLTHTIIDFRTLGQYTGVDDKNNTKIFENDKVTVLGKPGIVKFNLGAFYIDYSNGDEEQFSAFHSCYIEVIGNIHDNE